MSPETSITPRAPLPAHLLAPLREHGFVREGRVYRRDSLTFAASGWWFVLSEQANGLDERSLSRSLGQPGLWKWVRKGAPPHRIFEIPSWAVSDQPEDDRLDESGPAAFGKLLDWALETRFGRVPSGWTLPGADRVGSWIPRGGLTVQAKGCVRQGELILGPTRWALRLPVLPQLAGDLPAPRRRALEDLVSQAQRHWTMVRLGLTTDNDPNALVAEVDFTGAPHSELLFSAGLDVLRHVVAWLVETADVLADASVAIACLAPGGDNNTSRAERNTP